MEESRASGPPRTQHDGADTGRATAAGVRGLRLQLLTLLRPAQIYANQATTTAPPSGGPSPSSPTAPSPHGQSGGRSPSHISTGRHHGPANADCVRNSLMRLRAQRTRGGVGKAVRGTQPASPPAGGCLTQSEGRARLDQAWGRDVADDPNAGRAPGSLVVFQVNRLFRRIPQGTSKLFGIKTK